MVFKSLLHDLKIWNAWLEIYSQVHMFLVFWIWSSTDSNKIRNYLSNLLYMNIKYFLEIRKTEEIPPSSPLLFWEWERTSSASLWKVSFGDIPKSFADIWFVDIAPLVKILGLISEIAPLVKILGLIRNDQKFEAISIIVFLFAFEK